MRNSVLRTLTIPAVGSPKIEPALLFQAGDIPMRVVIRNIGAAVLLIAHDVGDVSNINSSGGTYSLPPGQSDVFVLAPRQSLLSASSGAGGRASVAGSEAIPLGKSWMES